MGRVLHDGDDGGDGWLSRSAPAVVRRSGVHLLLVLVASARRSIRFPRSRLWSSKAAGTLRRTMAVHAHDQQLSDHYVICGYGRIGSIVANEFSRQKTPFVIVDRSPTRPCRRQQHGHLAVEGDASREETLNGWASSAREDS